jgi:hypothetical protein
MGKRPDQQSKTNKKEQATADNERSGPGGGVVKRPAYGDSARRWGDAVRHRNDRDSVGKVGTEAQGGFTGVLAQPEVRAGELRYLSLGTGFDGGDERRGLGVVGDVGVSRVPNPGKNILGAAVRSSDSGSSSDFDRLTTLVGIESTAVDDQDGTRGGFRRRCSDLIGSGEERTLTNTESHQDGGQYKTYDCENKSHG